MGWHSGNAGLLIKSNPLYLPNHSIFDKNIFWYLSALQRDVNAPEGCFVNKVIRRISFLKIRLSVFLRLAHFSNIESQNQRILMPK